MELSNLEVTAGKLKQFASKKIYTVRDLIEYLPKRYNDFSQCTGFLPPDQYSCIVAECKKIQTNYYSKTVTTAYCVEEKTGYPVNVTWFNQEWKMSQLDPYEGKKVFIAGKATYDSTYMNYTIIHPEIFTANIKDAMKLYPVYPKIAGMSVDYLTQKINAALMTDEAYREVLPEDVLLSRKLPSLTKTYQYLHWPKSQAEIDMGQKRLRYNDLIYFALYNLHNRDEAATASPYSVKTVALYDRILEKLPFQLTEDQRNAVGQMLVDARTGRRINALVQGDVGSGKSIIAFLMMAAFADNGYQTVLMAPTQVLARQHFNELAKLLAGTGMGIAFVSGERMSKAVEEKLLKRIRTGTDLFIIGTHAAFSQNIEYNNLALTIVDEEHKFGVLQREGLIRKAKEGVHSITMSATPIPRSLAHVVYGDDLQLYTINTMPEGRKKIITGLAASKNKLFRFLLSEIRQGHQVYVVCPMIEESDSERMKDVQSVEEAYAEYVKYLKPLGARISRLTGRNTREETEDIIQRFCAGMIDILISTTVIEVGVNVPNATVMVINNAERFGLSQMHQLRGRVGRSDLQSYCVLVSNKTDSVSGSRIETMCSTSSGFEIARADLTLRGPGEFVGTRQSGEDRYISLVLAYPDEYEDAKLIAKELNSRVAAEGTDFCEIVQKVYKKEE